MGEKMTPENFCYWLQGMLNLKSTRYLNKDQADMIRKKLNEVIEGKPELITMPRGFHIKSDLDPDFYKQDCPKL